MKTDWQEIGKRVGSIQEHHEMGGNSFASKAFEEILGHQWIEDTVAHILTYKPGTELAMNCLKLICSEYATLYAYQIYKSTTGDQAIQSAWLIKQIAHPTAFQWIEEFLNDPAVAVWGIGLLDQLLWTGKVAYDMEVERLLSLAAQNKNENCKEQVEFIRSYLEEEKYKS